MIVYGQHPVEEILDVAPEQIRRVVADHGGRFDGLEIPASVERTVDGAELDRITDGGNHQGIAAVLGDFQYTGLREILAAVESAATACVVVLDQVQDPRNLGAILRSAAALGADAVLIPKDRAAQVTHTVVRTSAGLAYHVPVCRVTNVARTLEELAEAGFWSVGMAMDGETELADIDFVMKTALVLGGEAGIRRLVLERCDFRARIPMAAGVESLNVSVAASIALYEIARQTSE